VKVNGLIYQKSRTWFCAKKRIAINPYEFFIAIMGAITISCSVENLPEIID
jgi:hypothetical protein